MIIIGAGIAGLCTAIGLHQVGLKPQVYEQAEQIQPVGAGLTLWPNALKVLAALGLAEAVEQAGSVITQTQIRSERGRVLTHTNLQDLSTHLGHPAIAIHRADLHRLLLAALPERTIHLGYTFDRFEQTETGVQVHFANGTVMAGEMLLGADGIRSKVRQQMWPEARPRYAGYVAWRGVAEGVHHLTQGGTSESWGRGQRFGIVPLNERQVYWFATANASEGEQSSPRDAAQEKEELLARFQGWHEPIQSLIEATPAETILRSPIADLRPLPQWHQGRVTLVGDAAHATTPNMGQGACQAIESSLTLAQMLGQPDVPDRLARYEQTRRQRTAWITNTSWRIGRAAQWENRILCAVRNQLVAMTPTSIMRRQLVAAATLP